jgi:hypothetical protein
MGQQRMKQPAQRCRQQHAQQNAAKHECAADRALPPAGERQRDHQKNRQNPNCHGSIKKLARPKHNQKRAGG